MAWGGIIAISAYPTYKHLATVLGGRRKLAASVTAFVLAAVLFVPFSVLVLTLGQHIGELAARLSNLDTITVPPPPGWLGDIPLVGRRLLELWNNASTDVAGTIEALRPQIRDGLLWLLSRAATSTLILLEAALAIILSAFFLLAATRLRTFFLKLLDRLGAEDSTALVTTIERTTRSVSKGIIGTAFIQAVIAWAGFVIVGVPGAILLAFISFILCSIQLGIMLVGIPVAVWLWTQDNVGGAVFIIIWSLFVSVIDNVLKPILLGRNFPVPIWLIFVGIIGGLLAMGLIGLFIGPIILAISYLLIMHWTLAEP
jgi:predicted PurR-regulated permease PerM